MDKGESWLESALREASRNHRKIQRIHREVAQKYDSPKYRDKNWLYVAVAEACEISQRLEDELGIPQSTPQSNSHYARFP